MTRQYNDVLKNMLISNDMSRQSLIVCIREPKLGLPTAGDFWHNSTYNEEKANRSDEGETKTMKASEIKTGMMIWIPCEVKGGPFPNERRAYLKLNGTEWFGFVDVSQLKDKVPEGHDFVRATVIGVQKERVALGIHGQAPASSPIETNPAQLSGFSLVAT